MAQRSSTSSSHSVCPVEIRIRGRRAVSESTGSIMARFEHKGALYDCTSFGRFISRLELERRRWKLITLEVIYDRDTIYPVTPTLESKVICLDLNARLSYRCLAWVLDQNGFSINQDLPGTDRPGSGAVVIRSCIDWLYAIAAGDNSNNIL